MHKAPAADEPAGRGGQNESYMMRNVDACPTCRFNTDPPTWFDALESQTALGGATSTRLGELAQADQADGSPQNQP